MDKSDLPSILRPIQQLKMSNVDVFTSILDSQNATQRRVIFNLRQQGILSPDSRVVMSVHPTAAVTTGFLPIGVGIGACIETATLRCSTRVLATNDQFGSHYFVHRGVHTKSQKQNIDMVLDGGCSNVGNSPNVDGAYSVDVASAIYSNKTTALVPAKYKPVQSLTDCPLYSLSLSDLFPMMKDMMLPLQFIPLVTIELTLRQQANPTTGVTMNFSAAPVSSETTYGLNNFQMHVDYLSYDQNTMNEVRDKIYSDVGMPIIYSDLAVTTTSIPGVVQPASNAVVSVDVTREIGSAGLKVKNVVIVERNENGNALFGRYRSDAPIHVPEYQFRYNNRLVYNRKMFNPSFMRNEVEGVLRFPFSVPNCVYSHDVSNDFFIAGTGNNGRQNELMDAGVTFEGQSPELFAGTNFVTGIDLRKGPRGSGTNIMHKNILYERTQKFSRDDYSKIDITMFVEYERSFIIRDGLVLTST